MQWTTVNTTLKALPADTTENDAKCLRCPRISVLHREGNKETFVTKRVDVATIHNAGKPDIAVDLPRELKLGSVLDSTHPL